MIKSSTVIKRMIKDGYKPVLYITLIIGSISGASVASNHFLGWDAEITYWSLLVALFLFTGIKWSYECKKNEIEWEQKKMMQDLSKGVKQ
jgi:hypothetical protein